MAVTLRSGIIIGLIGLALIGIGYNAISSSDQDTIVGLGTLFFLAGIFILLTSILGLLLILYKAIIGPNATYEQYEKSLRKLFFFWVMMLIADSVGLFMFIKMRSFLLFIIGLLLILPLISIMWGASAQLKALRRIRNTVVSMRYMDREAEEITMDVVKFLQAGAPSLTPSSAGPAVPSWTEISGVELSTVINNVLNIRNRK